MKRVALLFVLAVLVPSLLLAVLAARSRRDQLYVVERQQSLFCQSVADSLASEIQDFLLEHLRSFGLEIERLLLRQSPEEFAQSLDASLTNWPLAEVGFAVTTDGLLLCPASPKRPAAVEFVTEQSRFFSNREAAEVYWNVSKQAYNASGTEWQQRAAATVIIWPTVVWRRPKRFFLRSPHKHEMCSHSKPSNRGAFSRFSNRKSTTFRESIPPRPNFDN